MPGRRNPLKLHPWNIKLPSRGRPDPFPSDDDLRLQLLLWKARFKLAPNWQVAFNFRLGDLLAEKRVRRSPMQQALVDVAALTSGQLGPGWSETHACKEVSRVRGLDADLLARAWRRKKKQPAKPRTKSP